MPAQNVRSVRIVVQHIYNDWRSSYRLVAYGDRQVFRPLKFESLHDLLNALRSVMPDFDENSFLIRNGARDSYIVFAREVELSDSQLSTLGLKDGPEC
jgi:hypothetical protein